MSLACLRLGRTAPFGICPHNSTAKRKPAMACVRKKLPCVCTMVIFTPQGLITMSSFVSTPSLFFLARAKEKLSSCSVDSGTCQSLFLSRRSTSESSSSADIHTCMYDMVGAHMNEHKEGREQVSVWDITHTYDLYFYDGKRNSCHSQMAWLCWSTRNTCTECLLRGL